MSGYIPFDRRQMTAPTGESNILGLPVTFIHQLLPGAFVANESPLAALGSATAWLNTDPLTGDDLRGKVVLIDFWTYTCINWLRTLPYIRAWDAKYQGQGLRVISVHAPEFPFEHDITNVRREAEAMQVMYPIALDNQFTIWRAFENHYWPALYLLDGQGQMRYHHFGEGEYGRSERMIQQLLGETGAMEFDHDLVTVEGRGAEAAADWDDLQTPETYLNYERTEHFSSPGGIVPDQPQNYTFPSQLRPNAWALAGAWTVDQTAAVLRGSNGRIAFRFHARDLNVVMGPATAGTTVRFQVLLDGQLLGEARGSDVDAQGNGVVDEPRLYQLIRQSAPITTRQCEILFPEADVAAFAFTFG